MTIVDRIGRLWLNVRVGLAVCANRAKARRGGIDIVFLGDSITEQWLWRQPRFFRPRWYDAGIGGETTVQMRARFERDVIAHRPRAVHIMAGTNDMWHGNAGPDATHAIDNIAAMVAMARAAGIAVILAPPPPIAGAVIGTFRTPELFAPLHAAIAALCARDGLMFVDYAASLSDASGRLIPANMTDGVHISRQGYRAMQPVAEAAIARALTGDGHQRPA